ncbi:MAG: DNA repair protein RecN [Firmicutes bacterium]|nr:DNA repair protein RecN [Bacillota bacterium]
MLQLLKVQNVALISSLEVEFSDGLNVLSGETGAGKSIIIDAINFCLGEKADKSIIKHGTEKCVVTAIVDYSNPKSNKANDALAKILKAELESLGVDYDETDSTVILHRSLTTAGKSDVRINGTPVTLAGLKRIASLLIDIHGQHAHQSLFKKAMHTVILDSFSKEIPAIKNQLSTILTEYKQVEKGLKALGGDEASRARHLDLLSYQINEIEQANLVESEESELSAARNKMMNAERLKETANVALEILAEGAISVATKKLEQASNIDNQLEELAERLSSASYEISDIYFELKNYIGDLFLDERELERIENRLNKIRELKKKYGQDVPTILQFLQKAKAEYDTLTNASEQIEKLQKQKQALLNQLVKNADTLHQARQKTSLELEKKLIVSLADLGLASASFKVSLQKPENFANKITQNGYCDLEFLFSANKGQPLKPLAKIVSGGEASRFSLALKDIVRGFDSTPTLIFDEIDAGIGGKIGQVVAQKLANIASANQVLCITHLPQIAAMANTHFLIEKHETKDDTKTTLTKLDDKKAIDEIARLSGGQGISKSASDFAAELTKWAKEYKKVGFADSRS